MARSSAEHLRQARPEERISRWPDPEESGRSLRASGERWLPGPFPRLPGWVRADPPKKSGRCGTPSPTLAVLWVGRAPMASCVSRKPVVAPSAGWGAPGPNSGQVEGTGQGSRKPCPLPCKVLSLTCALDPPVHPQPSQRLSLGPGPPHQPTYCSGKKSPTPSLPQSLAGSGPWGGCCTAEGGWRWARLRAACTSSSTHHLFPGGDFV